MDLRAAWIAAHGDRYWQYFYPFLEALDRLKNCETCAGTGNLYDYSTVERVVTKCGECDGKGQFYG